MRTLLRLPLLLLSLSAAAQTFTSFEVMPSVAVKGVTHTIRLRAEDGFHCNNPPIWCGIASVTIGGVKSPSIQSTELFAEWEVAVPDLEAGTVADIVVTDQNGNVRRKSAALHIIDPSEPYSPETFDRVLIPVIFEGPGQNGSRWTTDVWLMNVATYPIPLFLGPAAQLEREQIVKIQTAAPNGYVLYPARSATDDVAVNVLVRDLSRQSEALGTELPAVRESRFEKTRIQLMNVPTDPKFRLTLRLYAFERRPFTQTLTYWLHPLEGGDQVVFSPVTLQFPANGNEPWSATVDLMAAHPEIAGKGPLRLTVKPLRPQDETGFWAFLTVTNNETQHVTAITPNP